MNPHERCIVRQRGADFKHLAEGLDHVFNVHMTQDDAQAVAPLQLLDAVVHVLGLQQMEPAADTFIQVSNQNLYSGGKRQPAAEITVDTDVIM